MRAFTKEVSASISECKAWNAEYKLAKANNAQVGWQLAIIPGGGQNCKNGQGQANQH